MWRSHDEKYERPIGTILDLGEDRRIAGELNLKRADLFDSNVIHVFSDEFFNVDEHGSLTGVSNAGMVSLLDCVRGGFPTRTNHFGFTMSHSNMAFRYALFGSRHISPDEDCLHGIRFTIEGAASSVFANDEFKNYGHIFAPDEETRDVINRNKPSHLKGDLKESAIVDYFTGDYELLPETKTALGTVVAYRTLHATGRAKMNTTDIHCISIDFDEPATVEDAWEKMREVRQFFAWMMGYVPTWKNVVVVTKSGEDESRRRDGELQVFGPNEWAGEPSRPTGYGSLIDASTHPVHFMEVMSTWLQRNADERRRSANGRFFGGFRGRKRRRALEDAIVSNANMFDLLPDEDRPKVEPLPQDALSAINEASKKIKHVMANHSDRNEVLRALGNVRANKTLRDVVEHRAKPVAAYFGEGKLKTLQEDIRLAVLCRNYYTHGPRAQDANEKVGFSHPEAAIFLAEILRFIYCASELLLCGWNPDTSDADIFHPVWGLISHYESTRAVQLTTPSNQDRA